MEYADFIISGSGGTEYLHPATHPASMITGDASKRFVSDTQISNWNAGGGGGVGLDYEFINSARLLEGNMGYIVDTTSSAFILNLPVAPSVGTRIGIIDAGSNFDVNNMTLRSPSVPIAGILEDLVCDIKNVSFKLIYTGLTGWQVDRSADVVINTPSDEGVNWVSISTNTIIENGNGYMVDSSTGPIIVTLPSSPSIGDRVLFVDVTSSFDINNLTINGNGQKIMGLLENMIVDTINVSFQLVFADATNGWRTLI